MKLFTTVNFSDRVSQIDHSTKLLAMGSCFAEHIGGRLIKNHFDIILNPFGISYHPLVLHQQLFKLTNNQLYQEKDLVRYNDLWHTWDHHSRFSNTDKDLVLDSINNELIAAQNQFEKLDHLLITFGSSYGYQLKKEGSLVSNCHKYPGDHFNKFLSNTDELIVAWTELIHLLKQKNKHLKITLTVSPVRHKKEGLVENNRSKARCLLLCEKLVEEFTDCYYFPAYEIVLDELRDYRFFNSDLVHPSDQAVQFIWEKYGSLFFNNTTQEINKKLTEFNNASTHRPFQPNSNAHQLFLKSNLEKLKDFEVEYPFINCSNLKDSFSNGII